MPTKKPAVLVLFKDEEEKEEFVKKAHKNERSVSNEFRALADLPELKHGGSREAAGRKPEKDKKNGNK